TRQHFHPVQLPLAHFRPPQSDLLPEALLGDISVEDKRGHYHRGTTPQIVLLAEFSSERRLSGGSAGRAARSCDALRDELAERRRSVFLGNGVSQRWIGANEQLTRWTPFPAIARMRCFGYCSDSGTWVSSLL